MSPGRTCAVVGDAAAVQSRHPHLFASELRRRARAIAIFAVMAAVAAYAFWHLEFSLARLGGGLIQLVHFVGLMMPPSSGGRAAIFLRAMGETLAIAFLGTLVAAILAFPVGFLAAKNVVANRALHFIVRRCLDTIRGVDVLIWALIFIDVVGLGPFAGILAIAVSDFAALAKLYSEAIEAADERAVEGVVAAGGSKLEAVRFGVLPQVLPVILSQALYYFESNTRSATIIGIVGAGGIGSHLFEQVRVLEWQTVAFLILIILVTVAVIDWLSTRLRLALIGHAVVPA